MDWRANCAAVIPCLNENITIATLVRSVSGYVKAVYIVDDGSIDDTGKSALRAGAQVVRHAINQGKGAALRTGWEQARKAGYIWALTLDGDGQHSPDDIPDFFERAESSSAALVVGNRMIKAAEMPRLRRFVNQWMSRRLSRVARQELPDSQCGFRLINLDVLARLPIGTSHFEIESEVLLDFVKAGYKVEFIPIQVIYKAEQSKIQPLRDAVRWFRWWRGVKRASGPGQ